MRKILLTSALILATSAAFAQSSPTPLTQTQQDQLNVLQAQLSQAQTKKANDASAATASAALQQAQDQKTIDGYQAQITALQAQ